MRYTINISREDLKYVSVCIVFMIFHIYVKTENKTLQSLK